MGSAVFGSRRVRRTRSGQYELRLPPSERELVATLVSQLGQLLGADDPSLRRLFPTAYPEDQEREAEYRKMVGDELMERHREALATVERTVAATRLEEDELLAWMAAINDVRLVLGTRLDVSEDTDLDVDPSDPEAPLLAAYGYLGFLLEEVVDALSRGS